MGRAELDHVAWRCSREPLGECTIGDEPDEKIENLLSGPVGHRVGAPDIGASRPQTHVLPRLKIDRMACVEAKMDRLACNGLHRNDTRANRRRLLSDRFGRRIRKLYDAAVL